MIFSGACLRGIIRKYRTRTTDAVDNLFDCYRENWSSGEANRQRGRDWLDQIYKANHKSTENTLAAHQDFCTWMGE